MRFATLFDIFQPPPRYNCREWADEFRFLSSEASAKPGKYRSEFAPYQREPMEAANDNTVQTVCLMWASQVGKTETVNNVVGYFIDADPSPILMVQPTVEFAESWSKERLVPMIRDCPRLTEKVKDPRSRDSGNTILSKQYPGGNIAIVGANAPAGLAGRPRRVVIFDEVDRYPVSAGSEGDPVSLGVRRTESFWNSVIYLTSTPTTKGISRIEKEYLQTDQRKWFIPCHACGERQVVAWSQVKWDDGKPETAKIVCEQCGADWNDEQRLQSVKAGEWRPTADFTGKRGYWINGICSPFRHKKGYENRLHQMASQFLEAKAGGEETLKTWVNTFLAETWEGEGDSINSTGLVERCEDYGEKLPEGVMVLTVAADVQKDRIEAEIVGWGEGEESWGIQSERFIGDTEKDEVFERYREFCTRVFEHPRFGTMRPQAITIDAGYRTDRVYRWVNANRDLNIYAVMGSKNKLREPVMAPKRRSRAVALQVCTHTFKTAIYARLRIDTPGPRYQHFPRTYDAEYFEQLTAEKATKRFVKGFPRIEWENVRPNKRNEALDIRVYNHAALWLLKVDWRRLKLNLEKLAESRNVGEISKANDAPNIANPLQPQVPRPRRGGFASRWK